LIATNFPVDFSFPSTIIPYALQQKHVYILLAYPVPNTFITSNKSEAFPGNRTSSIKEISKKKILSSNNKKYLDCCFMRN
jgi:hypothetical protein